MFWFPKKKSNKTHKHTHTSTAKLQKQKVYFRPHNRRRWRSRRLRRPNLWHEKANGIPLNYFMIWNVFIVMNWHLLQFSKVYFFLLLWICFFLLFLLSRFHFYGKSLGYFFVVAVSCCCLAILLKKFRLTNLRTFFSFFGFFSAKCWKVFFYESMCVCWCHLPKNQSFIRQIVLWCVSGCIGIKWNDLERTSNVLVGIKIKGTKTWIF